MSVVVISNATATRARRGITLLRQALPADTNRRHHVTESADALTALVGHDRWQSTDLLVINGGDGTVQHALTALMGACPPLRWPRIACLPGGTTNMTAYDLNAHRRFEHCVGTLRRSVDPGGVPPAPRSVVQVQEAPGKVRCGLFFGTGSIVQGIEYFQHRIRHNGGGHELGAGAALLRTLWGIARHEPPFSEPLTLRIEAPELIGDDGELTARLLFATTLDRLFLGIRPYWSTGPGALKTTLVERRARHFVTSMPRLLRGRPGTRLTPTAGYHSARLAHLRVTFQGSYTLDGELFPAPATAIDVAASEQVKFVPL